MCAFLRWKDLCSHEDLLHQFRQDVEEVRQVQVHVLVLLQFRRVQLEGKQEKKEVRRLQRTAEWNDLRGNYCGTGRFTLKIRKNVAQKPESEPSATPPFTSQDCLLSMILRMVSLRAWWTNGVAVAFMYCSISVLANVVALNNVVASSG